MNNPSVYILRLVFREKRYWFLTSVVAFLTIAFVVLLPNFKLIKQIFIESGAGAGLVLMGNLLASIGDNLTLFSILITVLLGIMLGVNISLLIYKLRTLRKGNSKTDALGGVGFFVGLLGVGCAACGTALIAALLPFGIGSLLLFLPFGGLELQILALLLLGFSSMRLLKEISSPAVCEIPGLN